MSGHATVGSFSHRWLKHWLTGAVLTLLFLVPLLALEKTSLGQAVERAGRDVVMRVYADLPRERKDAVIWIASDSTLTTDGLADLLAGLRDAGPRGVVIDLEIQPGAPPASIGKLLAVLKAPAWKHTVVTLPISNAHLDGSLGNRDTPWIRMASLQLMRDSDEVVRSMHMRACHGPSELPRLMPTLAATMRTPLPPVTAGCATEAESYPILFTRELFSGDDRAAGQDGILRISPTQAMAADRREALKDSYIVIGSAQSEDGRDVFLTPLGRMEGALIHAQAVRTFTRSERLPVSNEVIESAERKLARHGFELLAAIFFFSPVLAVCTTWIEAWSPSPAEPGFRQAVTGFFRHAVLGLFLALGVLLMLGALCSLLLATRLEDGLWLGPMTLVFGSALETLLHVGRHWVAFAEWLVDRTYDALGRGGASRQQVVGERS